jgi:hypothetical protein
MLAAAQSPVARLDAIVEYVSVAAGLEDMSKVMAHELPMAFDILVELNDTSVELLSWQQAVRKDGGKYRTTDTADYDGRELAIIISTIASAFGWDEERIISLQPEVAACYVQEILVEDWERREFEYSLSEVAYDHKTGRYRPFPRLDWHAVVKGPTVEQAKAKVPKKFAPSGIVMETGDNGAEQKQEQD